MSSNTNPLTTLYRLAVMLGVLAVGSMAAFRYGPEPGELAEMIDGMASMVVETPAGSDPTAAAASEPVPFTTDTAKLAPMPPARTAESAEGRLQMDPAVRPASAVLPLGAPPVGPIDPLEQARLTAPLHAAGATRASITPWGSGSAMMYRASASVPAGDASTGLERRLDALGDSPEAAVAALQQQVHDASFR